MATHNELGVLGERLAVNLLQKKGYTILERNWRYLKAEIDILAIKEGVLVVVEVKTRSTDVFGDPQNFISSKKIKLLVMAANQYVVARNLNHEVRFDVVAVLLQKNKKKLLHLENAFLHF